MSGVGFGKKNQFVGQLCEPLIIQSINRRAISQRDLFNGLTEPPCLTYLSLNVAKFLSIWLSESMAADFFTTVKVRS